MAGWIPTLSILVGLTIPHPAVAQIQLGRDVSVDLVLGSESAVETTGLRAQKAVGRLESHVRARLASWLELNGVAHLEADLYDRIEPGPPHQIEVSRWSRRAALSDQATFSPRELYLDVRYRWLFLRAGKQQIVWGNTDGIKVLDVANPQNFSEFALADFDDSRIPLWSVAAEVPLGPLTAQLVWIPDGTRHDLPDRNALFAFSSPRLVPQPPAGVEVSISAPDRGPRSDFGARVSAFVRGWDLTAIVLRHTQDLATLSQARSQGPSVTIRPVHQRSTLLGATAANAFGSFTIRTEVGYQEGRELVTADPNDADGVVRTGLFEYGVGVDWFGLSDTFVSGQLFQSVTGADVDVAGRDRVDSTVTALVRRMVRNDRLELEALGVMNLDQRDGYTRVRARYEIRTGVYAWIGHDQFFGSFDGLFGQFGRRDRVVFGSEWSL